jgi:hypothetical protein
MTKKNTGSNGYQNLHIEVLVKGDWAAWLSHSA